MGIDAGARGEGTLPGFLLFIDVEKAFDCMQLPSQVSSLQSVGVHPDRSAAYMCEMLHSAVWV